MSNEPVVPLSDSKFWEHAFHGTRRSQRYLPNPRWRLAHFELDRVFKKLLPRQVGLRLLEIGCGSSVWLPYFHREFGYEVFGIDYTRTGVEQARVNLSRAGCEGSLVQADFFDMEHGLRNQFDLVVSFGVIEHFDDPGAVIRHFGACLRPNGILITYIPNIPGIMGPILRFVDRAFYETHKSISQAELNQYHQEAGLDVSFSSYIQLLDMNILHVAKLGPQLARLAHGAFAALDLPVLFACRLLDRTLPSATLSSATLVLARKMS